MGTPKSATTYLQALLCAARPELQRRGVLYPGEDYLPLGGLNQQPVVYALAGPEVRWINDAVRERGRTLLPHLTEELGRHGGAAIVSTEALASFSTENGRAVVEALGYPPEQVGVVVTVRDFGRLLTSVWQENVKNGAVMGMTGYLESVAALRDQDESPFWNAYGLPRLVDRWADVVGMERVTVVTVPHADRRDELWPRYCRALGVADLPLPASSPEHKRHNVSLTASQIELLREVNVLLEKEDMGKPEQQRLRDRMLTAWMAAPSRPGRGLVLGSDLAARVVGWAEEDIAGLEERTGTGLRVQGDLAELRPRPQDQRPDDTGAAPSLADAAGDLLALVRGQEPAASSR